MFPFFTKQRLKKQMKTALEQGELLFFYQPQWDMRTNRIVGVEALLRWRLDDGKYVLPMEFIPKWERVGLLADMTPHLFDWAIRDMKQLHDLGFNDLTMAVNLSVSQLNETLSDTVLAALQKYEMSPRMLECELTETMPLGNPEKVAVFNRLSYFGVQLSADDFGTGYTTTKRLPFLNIRKVKIDQSYVAGLSNKKVQTLINSAHKLKLLVLAEGIETAEENDQMKCFGVDMGQGYFVARPMPLKDLIPFLKDREK